MAFELLERTSLFEVGSFFITERRMVILKEALERIRVAEDDNSKRYQELLVEMDELQLEKNKMIQTLQLEQQQIRKEKITRREAELMEEENILQTRLLNEAKAHEKEDEEMYQQHKQAMITQIMNEMRERYGC